jgi:hypothetical protein
LRRSTHKEIGNRILEQLQLSDSPQAHAFRVAVSAPDTWGEEEPHHSGRDEEIRGLILEARRLRLRGDDKGSMRSLGYALHYLQDHWTHTPGRGPPHHAYERRVDEAPLRGEREDAPNLTEDARRTYEEVDRLLSAGVHGREETLRLASLIPGEGSPAQDKQYAYRVSLCVASSILSDEAPRELQEEERQIQKTLEAELRSQRITDIEHERDSVIRGDLIQRILKLPQRIRIMLHLRRIEDEQARLRRSAEEEIRRLHERHGGWYAPREPVDI